MEKFKVGDKVKYLGDCVGIIGCIHNNQAYMSECVNNKGHQYEFGDGGCCPEHRNFMSHSLDCLEKVEPNKISKEPMAINEESGHPMHEYNGNLYVDDMVFGVDFGPSTLNKLKDKTMEIVKFAKNLTLSKNEKLMRKQGLKDENGIYTDAYTEIVDNIVYSEYEVKVLEIAKQADEDEKK